MIDTEIKNLINKELERQNNCIELIASENFVSDDILEATGSILTNKYAEGYPNKRYYNGCMFVDKIEQLAIDRCKELFKCEHVNVQPHSGSQANMAVYLACLNVGDTVLAMDLCAGGHLTHGAKVNFSGKLYNFVHYRTNDAGVLDYTDIRKKALEVKPKLIVCGASNYSRQINFYEFYNIAKECGALLMADISHIAGLVATGLHQSPVPYADFVTTTTHKSLRGPRGAVIMCKEAWAKKIDSTVFPFMQGGPLEHIIAGKAICFKEASTYQFYNYASKVINNAKSLCKQLISRGINIVSGGTDNHLMTINLTGTEWTGKDLANKLDELGITVNKNTVPNDTRGPQITSGVRIGVPAITSRNFDVIDCEEVANIIADVIHKQSSDDALRERIIHLCQKHPLHYKRK